MTSAKKVGLGNVLPDDDELVNREKCFLNLFEKFSVDENSDAEMADYDENDLQNDSDNSYSDSISVASSEENDDNIDQKLTAQLQPVIDERVRAWPMKGVRLVLKTVDPSVTVDEWLQMNSEFTKTTKEFKKTVIEENNKKTFTTTKKTTTTTRKCETSIRIEPVKNYPQKEVENEKSSNVNVSQNQSNVALFTDKRMGDNVISNRKTDKENKQSNLPSNIGLEKLNPMRSTTYSIPISANDILHRNARKTKDNVLVSIPPETVLPQRKRLKFSTKDDAFPSPGRTAMQQNRLDISATGSILNKATDWSARKLDSPPTTGIHLPDRTARKRKRLQTNQIRLRKQTVERSKMSLALQSINHSPDRTIMTPIGPPHRIVIYSPSHKNKLGTRIDRNTMLVKRSDYEKCIDTKCLADESVLNDSIISINRRIIYEPPTTDTMAINDDDDDDSDVDDILMTSYTSSGHLYHINL